MRALLCVLLLLIAPLLGASDYPPVRAGRAIELPADSGAHPDFRTEWWYVTGWVADESGVERGFQITFFRVRSGIGEDAPGRFSPAQLILAHAAVADAKHGRLLHAQRSARASGRLAGAARERTHAWVGNWRLEEADGSYVAEANGQDFAYRLELTPTQPPMLNGDKGYSQKAPDPANASYYYSRPQLAVRGTLSIDGRERAVSGKAWLDQEWSSEYMPAGASGWDWIGVNLDDGGALMAFRMRDDKGGALWSAGTLRDAAGRDRPLDRGEVHFEPLRHWRSPRTDVDYAVAWRVHAGVREFELRPLMDDQELDSRGSTGAIYWEGAVRVFEGGREIGRGYLEMTGYARRLEM